MRTIRAGPAIAPKERGSLHRIGTKPCQGQIGSRERTVDAGSGKERIKSMSQTQEATLRCQRQPSTAFLNLLNQFCLVQSLGSIPWPHDILPHLWGSRDFQPRPQVRLTLSPFISVQRTTAVKPQLCRTQPGLPKVERRRPRSSERDMAFQSACHRPR